MDTETTTTTQLAAEDDPAAEIRAQLAAVEAKLAALNLECDRTSGLALNPDNEIGGIRSRSRRQKGRIINRWDRQSADMKRLTEERKVLQARLRAAEAAPLAAKAEEILEARVRGLAPGDLVWCGYPEPCEVIKVNQKSVSVRTPGGRREAVAIGFVAPASPTK